MLHRTVVVATVIHEGHHHHYHHHRTHIHQAPADLLHHRRRSGIITTQTIGTISRHLQHRDPEGDLALRHRITPKRWRMVVLRKSREQDPRSHIIIIIQPLCPASVFLHRQKVFGKCHSIRNIVNPIRSITVPTGLRLRLRITIIAAEHANRIHPCIITTTAPALVAVIRWSSIARRCGGPLRGPWNW